MAKSITIPCDDLRRLYEEVPMTSIQLGTYYACSVTTIIKVLRRCGVVMRHTRFQERSIPEDELQRMYVVEGLPVAAIARHFGVAVSTIYNRRRAYGLPLRRKASSSTHTHYP